MTVPAASRTLDILEVFARERRPLSVSAIAKATGMPLSSCHGLVKTLETRGYLFESKAHGGYYFSRLLGQLAHAIGKFDPLPEWLVPALAQLRDACSETVVLAQLTGTQASYVEVFESTRALRFAASVGDTLPLHASAVGLALLGALPARERDLLLQGERVLRCCRVRVRNKALLEELEASRARGWYRMRGEGIGGVEDVSAIADALAIGGEYYAFAIVGPSARIERSLERHVELLTAFSRACRAKLADVPE